MKHLVFSLFACSFLIMSSFAQERASTKAENVGFLKREFVIPQLNDISHKVWLYLPPNYKNSKESYPVIYMHDGQNLFDNKTSFVGEWKVDETLNALYAATGKGFIVVGVENGGKERINEYTPWSHERYGGGKGKLYIDFIVNTLKPYVDKHYRTKSTQEFTGLIGSSLGGLISFYGGLEHPDVFGKIGALSTSFWFSDKVYDFIQEKGNVSNVKLYLLVGGKEGESMVPDMYKAKKLLLAAGFNKENITDKLNKDAKHNEAFWSSEFKNVVRWLYDLK